MLIYHPAYDVNHGMFRMLRLLEKNPEHRLKWDTFRILDLYYLFPHLLSDVSVPRNMIKAKKDLSAHDSKFVRIPTPRMFIQQMTRLHESIAFALVSKGFLEPEAFKEKTLVRTDRDLPAELSEGFAAATADQPLINMLAIQMASIPLAGANGLKARTGLLEYQYDPI